MGYTDSPGYFSRFTVDSVRDYINKFVAVYSDDVVTYTTGTKEEHWKHVKLVLEEMRKRKMSIKLKKCAFAQKEIEYLGFIIGNGEIKMNPEKVKAIIEWPTPRNVPEIRSFVGSTSQLRRFIKDHAKIAAPLTDLTKEKVRWKWQKEEQASLEKLKKAITEEPVLRLFDYEAEETTIEADASGKGLGAVLKQKDKTGKEHVVEYYSKKLSQAEQKYTNPDRELYAIVKAFEKWHPYLYGRKAIVKTDHNNIKFFLKKQKIEGKRARWALKLSEYDYEIQHIAGKQNILADSLSRRPDYMEGKTETPETELFKYEDDKIVQNPEAIYAQILQVQEKDTVQEIKTATEELSEGLKEIFEKNGLTINEKGVYKIREKIFVPPNARRTIIKLYHEGMMEGHPGNKQTFYNVAKRHWWPKMQQDVAEYVKICNECQRNKERNHKPYGNLQSEKIPETTWKQIVIDFIEPLPESIDPTTGEKCNAMLVVIDRFSKFVILIPTRIDINAKQMAHLLMKYVFSYTEFPPEMIQYLTETN